MLSLCEVVVVGDDGDESEETRFALQQQRQTITDSRNFVAHLAPCELPQLLDMESVEPLEGYAGETPLYMQATRLFTDHRRSQIGQAVGVPDLYREHDISTLYNVGVMRDVLFYDAYRQYNNNRADVRAALIKHLMPRDPITAQDTRREVITIRYTDSPLSIKILLDNWVYVTYICNRNEIGRRYKFPLLDLASHVLQMGVQHTKDKFSKDDIRYEHGSHLIFESSVIVETGSTNPVVAGKLLEYTFNVLRYVCGYANIEIRERECHNVVATGILNFGLCPELLKERYPYVSYERKNFAGAIIRIADIDAHAGVVTSALPPSTTTTVFDNGKEFIHHEKRQCHRNDEEIYRRKYNGLAGRGTRQTTMDRVDLDSTELDEFREPRDLMTPEQQLEYGVTVNYDEFDILQKSRVVKEKNTAALVFPLAVGKVICVGNKSREGVIESCYKLFGVMRDCRNSPENLRAEKQIILRRQRFLANGGVEPEPVPPPSRRKRGGRKKAVLGGATVADPPMSSSSSSKKKVKKTSIPIVVGPRLIKRKAAAAPPMPTSTIIEPVKKKVKTNVAVIVDRPEEEEEEEVATATATAPPPDGMVQCCHCLSLHAESEFDIQTMVSQAARLCYYCRYCVCHACFDAESYANDRRYASYIAARPGSDDDLFACARCITEQVG